MNSTGTTTVVINMYMYMNVIIIIIIPFTFPVEIYLWVKTNRPSSKVDPSNHLTEDVKRLAMIDL